MTAQNLHLWMMKLVLYPYATAAIQIYEKMMDGSTVARSLDFRTKGLEFKPVQQKRYAYFAMLTSVMS